MNKVDLKYIYGPVPSWRLGSSLGIDPLSQKDKICSFNCVYCQLGKRVTYSKTRKIYIPTRNIIKEIKSLPPLSIDYITLSGRGEPTLAENLGEIIRAIKKIRKEKTAVLTNSTLINQIDVRTELSLADLVVAKLDASDQESLKIINQPVAGLFFTNIISGLEQLRQEYKKKIALQMMFVKENKHIAKNLAELAKKISLDEIQINTPTRPAKSNTMNYPAAELRSIRSLHGHSIPENNVS